MKFQRYCFENDINIEESRHFGTNGIHGYVLNERYVYLNVSGCPNLYCEFTNNDNTSLTDDFLNEWARNTSALIKDTVGTVINPLLSIEVPSILRNLQNYENGDVYDASNPLMNVERSIPIVSLIRLNNMYFITIDGEPLYKRGITNQRVAEDLFNKLSRDISLYIKKRWPIK